MSKRTVCRQLCVTVYASPHLTLFVFLLFFPPFVLLSIHCLSPSCARFSCRHDPVKDADAISSAFSELRDAVGPLPLTEGTGAANGTTGDGPAKDGASGSSEETGSTTVTKNVVLPDGTYATQTTIIGACSTMVFLCFSFVFWGPGEGACCLTYSLCGVGKVVVSCP